MVIHNPLTGYEPNLRDNFDYSETSAAIFQDESGDIDTEPSYSRDAALDDEIIGKALSSPLFTHQREEPANLRLVTLTKKVCCQLSLFSHTSTGTPEYEPGSSQKRNERIRILLKKRKKSKFSLKSELRSRSTNFKPSLIEEVSRN